MTLSGTNTYTGGTVVGYGTLTVLGAASLPGYNQSGSAGVTVPTPAYGSSTVLTLKVGGSGEWTSPQIGALVASAAFSLQTTLGFDTTDAGGAFTCSAVISGPEGVAITGPNTFVLSGSNSYSGGTTIGGTLQISADGNLGAVPAGPTANIYFGNLTTLQFGGSPRSRELGHHSCAWNREVRRDETTSTRRATPSQSTAPSRTAAAPSGAA